MLHISPIPADPHTSCSHETRYILTSRNASFSGVRGLRLPRYLATYDLHTFPLGFCRGVAYLVACHTCFFSRNLAPFDHPPRVYSAGFTGLFNIVHMAMTTDGIVPLGWMSL